jgi:hypothetical protein
MIYEQRNRHLAAHDRLTIQLEFHVAMLRPNITSKMTNENMGVHLPLTEEKYSRATRRGTNIAPKIVCITSKPNRGRICSATIVRSGANGASGPRLSAEDEVDISRSRSGQEKGRYTVHMCEDIAYGN